jgi:hypothetical protein
MQNMSGLKWKVLLAMLAASVLTLSAGATYATVKGKAEAVRDEKNEGKDEEIAITDLPKAVVDAVNAAVPGGTIKEAEKETKGSEVVYEVKTAVGKVTREVKVSPDGKVLSNKVDDDDEDDDKK